MRKESKGMHEKRGFSWKKGFAWKPPVLWMAAAALLLLIIVLIPLLRILPYAIPWYDDYTYGWFARAALLERQKPWSAVEGAWECARVSWYAWQGTYASIFFMALVPMIWGEEYYFLGLLLIMLLLFVGVFALVKVLVRDILQADRAYWVILESVIIASVFMFIYSAQAGFFWYNGGIHYVGMHGIAMIFVVVSVKLLRSRSLPGRVLLLFCSLPLSVVTAGSNFVTTLQGLLVLLTVLALGAWFYRKRVLLLLPALGVYLFGFYKNVAAPGNHVRSMSYVGWGYSPIEAVLRSFLEAFLHLGEFTGWIMLAVLLFSAPLIWQMLGTLRFRFRYPGVVLLWSFCLYATGFTPSLYSLGHAGLSRTLNAVKLTYMLLLFLNEVYWLGWLRQRFVSAGKKLWGGAPWWFYPLTGLLMLVIFITAPNQAGCYSSYGAYYYVHTGEAYNLRQEYLERVEQIKNSGAEVTVEPYHFKPWFLYQGDLSEDPENEANKAIAQWYGKNAVICKEADID